MKINELFSKRQKRIRGEVPDVYKYKTIPEELRIQVVHIWMDVWGKVERDGFGGFRGNAYEAYEFIHGKLCREYGKFKLGEGSNFHEIVVNFLLNANEVDKALDVIEFSFRCMDPEIDDAYNEPFGLISSPYEAIGELNDRFREHGVGYQYESGQIVKVESQFAHSEVVKPALSFLSDRMYKGANEEFLKAHEHYRKRNHKDCMNNCLKAFESCLKTICKKRKWHYDSEKATANDLIQIVLSQGLIPVFMESHFSGLKSALGSGLSTLRNRRAGHGQGPDKIVVPEYVAAYALHLTASNILLLAKADEEMK